MIEQGSAEWLEMRRGKIGASDAPKIMGVSPWGTALQLWQEKVGLREPQKRNAAMQYGIDREASARELFNRRSGATMKPEVKVHPLYDWMMASYDGLSEDGKRGLEIKHCGKLDWHHASNGKVPEHYYPQLQHQIEVGGLDMVYYMSVHGEEHAIIEVLPDRDYIMDLVAKELVFWECMESFIQPPPTDRDIETRNDAVWCRKATRWREVKEMLQAAEEEEAQLREELITLSGGSNVVGGGIQLSCVPRKGAVNYKQIPELLNIDVEKYRKKATMSYMIKAL